MMEKLNTHIIIKKEDASKYLLQEEYKFLDLILNKITVGRIKDNKNPINNYYICNTDEPYADTVKGVIIGGEIGKEILSMVEQYE